jgi:hypothetical protein
MAQDPLTICLMGDTKFGKTSLIASLRGCVQQQAIGYKSDQPFEFTVVGQKPLSRDYYAHGAYNDIESGLFGVGQGTDVDKTLTYDFEVRARPNPSDPELTVYPIQVHDTGGAVWMSSVQAYVSQDSAVQGNFENYREKILPRATALILVIPLFESWEVESDVPWRRRMNELLEAIMTQPEFIGIRRIAVALTQYERLFVDFGALAATVAIDPFVAREIVKEALGRMRSQDVATRLLTHKTRDRQIVFVPVSAHGFARGNGCPNFDPGTNLLLRQRLGDAQETGRRALWRPFCTADPFLFAATGMRSDYMFSYAELFGETTEHEDRHGTDRDKKSQATEDGIQPTTGMAMKIIRWFKG